MKDIKIEARVEDKTLSVNEGKMKLDESLFSPKIKLKLIHLKKGRNIHQLN